LVINVESLLNYLRIEAESLKLKLFRKTESLESPSLENNFKLNAAGFFVENYFLKISTLDVDEQIKLKEYKPLKLKKQVENNFNLSFPEVQLQLNLKNW
jgi:hypothetical protein